MSERKIFVRPFTGERPKERPTANDLRLSATVTSVVARKLCKDGNVGSLNRGTVSTRNNRVLNGLLSRSPCPFALHHSLCSYTLLRLQFLLSYKLAQSLRSLPPWVVHKYVFTMETRSTGTIAFVVVTGNMPRFKIYFFAKKYTPEK